MDSKTLEQLRRLETLKREAVQNEDYQMAKNLKDRIQRLKNLGEQIALLESRKEKAIQKEDYDSAMVLKEEIQRLRGQFEIGGNVEDYGKQMGRGGSIGRGGSMGRGGNMDYDMGRGGNMDYNMGRGGNMDLNMGREAVSREDNRTRGFSGRLEEQFHVEKPPRIEESAPVNVPSREMNKPESDHIR